MPANNALVPMIMLTAYSLAALNSSPARAEALLKDAVQIPRVLQVRQRPLSDSALGEVNRVSRLAQTNTTNATPGADANQTLVSPALPSILQTPFANDKVNSCLVSVCGAAASNWATMNPLLYASQPESTQMAQMWNGDLAPLIKQAIDLDRQKSLKLINRIAELVKSGRKPSPGTPAQAYMTYQVLNANFLGSQIDSVIGGVNPDTMTFQINEAAVQAMLAKVTDVKVRAVVKQIFDKTYRPQILLTHPGTSGNPLLDRLVSRYPKIPTPKAALKVDAVKMVAAAKTLKSEAGDFLSAQIVDEFEISLFTKVAGGGDLSNYESQVYATAGNRLELLLPVFDSALQPALTGLGYDFAAAFQDVKTQGLVASRLEGLNSADSANQMKKVETICRPRIGVAMGLKASDLDAKTLSSIVDEITASAEIVTANLLTEKMKPAAADVVGSAQFVLPSDPASYVNNLKIMIATESKRLVADIGEIDAKQKDTDEVLMILAPLLVKGMIEGSSDLILHQCQTIPIDALTDYTLTAQGRIELSWTSVLYRDVGIGIAAHELGHVVSAQIRDVGRSFKAVAPGFLSKLNCVANRNPFVVKPVTLGYNDNTQWSEEDWADHFSSLVLNQMALNSDSWARYSKNLACALLTDDGKTYDGSSVYPFKGDIHSSGLLRILLVGSDRGEITPACRPLLGYASQNARQLSCQ